MRFAFTLGLLLSEFFLVLIGLAMTTRGANLENDEKESEEEVMWADYLISESERLNASRRIKREVKEMHLKVFVIIDYSLYQKWLQYESMDANKTLETIRYFYAHVINGVNSIYSSIDTSSYRYRVSLVGYYIAQTLENSNFTESSTVKTIDSKIVKFSEVLKILVKWAGSNAKMLPNFEVLVAFTTYKNPPAAGKSYLSSVCTNQDVIVVSSGVLETTINIAAHEIGHALGSMHDSDGNDCEKSKYYIMTPSYAIDRNNNYNFFSSCSIKYFETYIDSLKSSVRDTCFKRESSPEDESINEYLRVLPGQRFSPDQQCQHEYGKKAYYCSSGADAGNQICQSLPCYNPEKGSCFIFYAAGGVDGTPCGNKSWCIGGKCVADEMAPIGDDYCMYGDSWKTVTFNDVKIKCANVTRQPDLCYYDFFEKHCCMTCSSLANHQNEQCKYGDQNETFRYNNLPLTCVDLKKEPMYCYVEDFKEICCKTCSDSADQANPDCPYGDYDVSFLYGSQIVKCSDHESYSFLCETYSSKCCKSCAGS